MILRHVHHLPLLPVRPPPQRVRRAHARAFDAEKGRLWIVCPRCERWNLTPLEERWEAIEECERLFRDTRLRASTGQIGLARVAEGTELVRIGQPQRPEFAAWRYGDQFGRRRRRHVLGVSAAVAAGGAVVVAGMSVLTFSVIGTLNMIHLARMLHELHQSRRRRALLELADGRRVSVSLMQQRAARVIALPTDGDAAGWGLEIGARPLRAGEERRAALLGRGRGATPATLTLTGDDAVAVLGRILPAVNSSGARRAHVRDAVRLIEDSGSPDRLVAATATRLREWGRRLDFDGAGCLWGLPRPVRLALEMAVHEDAERAALEGELAQLRAQWQAAEEIAAIADGLALPPGVEERWREMREG